MIAQRDDQTVEYASALRLGTAEAEQTLRRCTKGGVYINTVLQRVPGDPA